MLSARLLARRWATAAATIHSSDREGQEQRSGQWMLDQKSGVLGVSFYLVLKCMTFHQFSLGSVI